MFRFLAIVALTVCLLPSKAAAQRWLGLLSVRVQPSGGSGCRDVGPVHVGRTQAYSRSTSGGKCFVSIHPVDSNGMVYRDYAFFGDGMLMVFNSYGDGEDTARLTSAREFWFFPRKEPLELRADPAGPALSVRQPDGGLMVFNPADGQLASVERGAVTVSPRIDPADRGGVEFAAYTGLLLDVGFRMGELPSMKPEGEAVFRSAYGQQCRVKNKELFAYAGGDRSFKFSDVELSTWLKTRCPGLYVDF